MSQSRKRTNEQIRRDRELRERELEAERIQTERTERIAAEIKAENLEQKRLNGHDHVQQRENLHHHWRGTLPGGIDFER